MGNQCINKDCQSRPKKKLFIAQKSVCRYYNVLYSPKSKVCEACMQKSFIYFDKIGRRFKNKECILDNYPKIRKSIIEFSDHEDDNATKPIVDPRLTSSLNTILNDTIKPLITKQQELCKNYLISKKQELIAQNNQLNNLVQQVDKGFLQLYEKINEINSQRNFKYDEEIKIIKNFVKCIPDEPVDNDVAIVANKQLPGFPNNLPVKLTLKRPLLKLGDKVYGMKYSLLQPWVEGTITVVYSDIEFNIIFDDGEEKVLNHKHLAYINVTSDTQYPIGTRVIANFRDMNLQLTDKFYVGIIAEPPKYLNNFRYMIFFDDGYTQYAYHDNIRFIVCDESLYTIKDVHENIREYIKEYLQKYPEMPMVKFNKKQIVRTELNNKWYTAKVKKIDASLVQLKFLDTKNEHTEWIYRGSNRLGPVSDKLNSNNQVKRVCVTNINKLLNRPYIELENLAEKEKSVNIANSNNSHNTRKIKKPQKNNGVIKLIEIPANCPKPFNYIQHQCSHFCMLWVHYDYNQTRDMNVLSIPLYYGFVRSIIEDEKLKLIHVIYTTPCGCKIESEGEMYKYLETTGFGNSRMTIDLFSFDSKVNPLSSFSVPDVYILSHDISYKMEFKPISVVNSVNEFLPKHIKYITERKTTPGVNMNLDSTFLCGCDCTDNCQDKNKCSCWQLTFEGPKNYPDVFKDHGDIGYSFKRLHQQLITGIYECNPSCKCGKTCLNRVVQEPLKTSLQLFQTEKKGWGVRTLADIPKGSFVCTYLGEVRTESDAKNDFSSNWGEYLVNLNFLKTVENMKKKSKDFTNPSDDEDHEEFNPSSAIKSKKRIFKSRISLRKNLQDTNTQIDGKHKLSKLNTQQRVGSKHKSLRTYQDKNCGIYTLDSKVSGNIGRYFNHSCDPNIFIQNVFIDTHDLRFPWVAYFALSNIPAGTELAWDYNYVIGSVENKTLQCNCGSKNCKGRLL